MQVLLHIFEGNIKFARVPAIVYIKYSMLNYVILNNIRMGQPLKHRNFPNGIYGNAVIFSSEFDFLQGSYGLGLVIKHFRY